MPSPMAKNPSIYYYTCAIRHKFFHTKKTQTSQKTDYKRWTGEIRRNDQAQLRYERTYFIQVSLTNMSTDFSGFLFCKKYIHSILEHQPLFSFVKHQLL